MGRKKVYNTEPNNKVPSNADVWWKSLKESIANAFGIKPIKIHGQDDWRTEFYVEDLKTIIKSIISVKSNMGNLWDIDYFKDVLLFEGKICITKVNGTIYPLRCGMYGVNVYERANYIQIANPVLGNFERTNGEDAAVIYLMDNKRFKNFSMLCNITACKLAMCDASIDSNLINTKLAYLIRVQSKKEADEAAMIYDKITRGDPAVIYEGSGMGIGNSMDFFNGNIKQNYITDLIQTEKRTIICEFLTKIGINNSNIEKKERMLYDEVNSNNMEIACNIEYIEEMVSRGVKMANKIYPELGLEITFPYLEEMRKRVNVNAESNGYVKNDGDKGN